MTFSFFKKTFRDFKWRIILYSAISLLYEVMMIGFYPSIRERAEEFKKIIEVYPKGLVEAFGIEASSFQSVEGFLSVEHFSLTFIIIIGIFIFSLGASMVASEKDKGTSEFSFTLPIRRYKIVLGKFISAYLMSFIVVLVSLIGVIVGMYAINETPKIAGFLAFGIVSLAMSFFLLSLTTFISAIFSSKGKVYGVCGVFFILSYLIHILNGMSEKVSDYYFLSFLKYYGVPEEILTSGTVELRNILVFLGVGVIFLTLGLIITEKRDL